MNYPQYQQPPAVPPKPKKKWPWVVGGVVAVIALGGAINSGKSQSTYQPGYQAESTPIAAPPSQSSSSNSSSYTYQAPASRVASTPVQTGPRTTFSDGTYEVGVDVEAGRYKTPGPDKSDIIPMCYWERAKDDSGTLKSIIANDNIQGPGSVTVKNGEFLKVSGGCTWSKQ